MSSAIMGYVWIEILIKKILISVNITLDNVKCRDFRKICYTRNMLLKVYKTTIGQTPIKNKAQNKYYYTNYNKRKL